MVSVSQLTPIPFRRQRNDLLQRKTKKNMEGFQSIHFFLLWLTNTMLYNVIFIYYSIIGMVDVYL